MTKNIFVKIPKGTPILTVGDDKRSLVPSTATSTIRVKVTPQDHYSYWDEDVKAIHKYLGLPEPQLIYELKDSYGGTNRYKDGRFHGKFPKLAIWGDYPHDKYINLDIVEEVDAPKKVERKETGPTMTQRLQVGTKWKLTEDIAVDKLTIVKNTNKNGYAWESHEYSPDGTIPAGNEFEVLLKPANPNYYEHGRDGTHVLVKFQDGVNRGLKVSLLKNAEATSDAPIVPVFVIRDSLTGEFYHPGEYEPDPMGVWRKAQYIMAPKFSGAKKWNRLSDVRSSMLETTGYYYDLPGSGNLPDWMGHSATIAYEDIPRTWEIAKVDKLTKKVLETTELLDTLDRAWRLRELTMQYGSGVRAVYGELEKKGALGDFPAMLVFSVSKEDRNHWWDEGLTDEQKAEIKEALESFNKNEIKRGKGSSDYAVAIKDLDAGVMIKLSYSGSMECHLLNLNTLTEVVDK